ncbi:MAG: hypothetical protein F4Y57_10445 [Acidobacteria bacterium]|nr:hypothetical protein [Acidobacteriota bacterium]
MKVEVGESLGYSYLRHVQQCWLVQTNWKASEHWVKQLVDDELEREFVSIRERLRESFGVDLGGKVECSQFLKQAEIDVVGVGLDGGIHAVEIAFHEGELQYTVPGGTARNVLKKMLRAMLILRTYHPENAGTHICFASPKVNPKTQKSLEDAFGWLRREYRAIDWQLLTNNDFSDEFLRPLWERARQVKDTSELFVRSLQLLELCGSVNLGKEN